MNTNTETMSLAGVLTVMDEAIRHAEERGHMIRSDNMQSARTAVAALIEREAALVATLAAHRLIPQEHIRLFGMSLAEIRALRAAAAERDALAERVKALEAALAAHEEALNV